jgi:hypothetical protein
MCTAVEAVASEPEASEVRDSGEKGEAGSSQEDGEIETWLARLSSDDPARPRSRPIQWVRVSTLDENAKEETRLTLDPQQSTGLLEFMSDSQVLAEQMVPLEWTTVKWTTVLAMALRDFVGSQEPKAARRLLAQLELAPDWWELPDHVAISHRLIRHHLAGTLDVLRPRGVVEAKKANEHGDRIIVYTDMHIRRDPRGPFTASARLNFLSATQLAIRTFAVWPTRARKGR